MNAFEVIKTLRLTEKGTSQSEKFNQYTVVADKRANKIQIRQAVEELFKVDVTDVSTMTVRGKLRRQRTARAGKDPDWKRARYCISLVRCIKKTLCYRGGIHPPDNSGTTTQKRYAKLCGLFWDSSALFHRTAHHRPSRPLDGARQNLHGTTQKLHKPFANLAMASRSVRLFRRLPGFHSLINRCLIWLFQTEDFIRGLHRGINATTSKVRYVARNIPKALHIRSAWSLWLRSRFSCRPQC